MVDGTLNWGSGSGAADTSLFRSAGSTLQLTNGAAGAAQLLVYGDVAARRTSSVEVDIGAAGPAAQSGIAFQGGEAGSNLYRSSAGVLQNDGALAGPTPGWLLNEYCR